MANPTLFQGVSGVLITPFESGSLNIDEIGLRNVVRTMDDGGIDVIVPCGGTGEFYSLTDAERRLVAEIVLDEAVNATVAVGVGRDVRSAVDAAKHAQDHGAAAVMVHQPVGGGLSREGVLAYYRAIADQTHIDLIAYARDPIFTGEFISTLANEARVTAVKYSINDPQVFASTVDIASCKANITWICGTA